MKERDLHTKQHDELMRKHVSSERENSKHSIKKSLRRDHEERRDVASEERIREKLKGKP